MLKTHYFKEARIIEEQQKQDYHSASTVEYGFSDDVFTDENADVHLGQTLETKLLDKTGQDGCVMLKTQWVYMIHMI